MWTSVKMVTVLCWWIVTSYVWIFTSTTESTTLVVLWLNLDNCAYWLNCALRVLLQKHIIHHCDHYYYYANKMCFFTCQHRHEIQEEEQAWHGYLPSCSGVQAEQVSRSHCAAVTSGSWPDPHPANVVRTEDWAGTPAASWDFQRSPDTAVQASRPAAQCTVPTSWASS